MKRKTNFTSEKQIFFLINGKYISIYSKIFEILILMPVHSTLMLLCQIMKHLINYYKCVNSHSSPGFLSLKVYSLVNASFLYLHFVFFYCFFGSVPKFEMTYILCTHRVETDRQQKMKS